MASAYDLGKTQSEKDLVYSLKTLILESGEERLVW